MGDENPIRTLGDYSKRRSTRLRNTIELPVGNNVGTDLRSDTHPIVQNRCSFHGLTDPITTDGGSYYPIPCFNSFHTIIGDISIRSMDSFPRTYYKNGPHDTQYCMEDPKQAFVEYASSHTDEAREGLVSDFMASQDDRLSKFEADFKQQQSKMTNKINTVLKAITDRIAGTLPSDTVKNPKLIPPSSNTELICTKEEDGDVMFIEIILKDDDSRKEEPDVAEQEVEYFDIFPTRDELTYH
ncbi:hypothetical protein Tco_1433416, partial [Tanacetum coccineum]